jgi:hypothetical protein
MVMVYTIYTLPFDPSRTLTGAGLIPSGRGGILLRRATCELTVRRLGEHVGEC